MAVRELGPQPREIPPDIAKQFRQRGLSWFIVTVVMVPMGAVSLAVIYFLDDPFQPQRLRKNGVHVTGTVTRITHDTSIRFNSAHPWLIRYTFKTEEGQVMYGQARTWDNDFRKKHPANGPIGILYMRRKPLDNRPADIHDRIMPRFVYLIPGIILFLGIVFFLVYRGVVSKARSLFVDGFVATGKVVSNTQVWYINIGWRHPYNIIYKFQDPNTRREYEGFMRSYSFDLAAKLKSLDEVTVLYDWENPERNMIVL